MATLTYPVRLGRHWLFPDGTLLPVISGGSDEGAAGDPPPPGGEGEGASGDQLGDAGKKALAAERTARQAAERELKATRAKAEADAKRLAELDEANKTEQEKAIEAARKEAADAARAEVESAYRRRINEARVLARAAGKFTDPSDAIRFLGDEQLLDTGEPDDVQIDEAISKVLESKPYLATTTTKHPANGAGDGGVKNGAIPQIPAEKIPDMTPEQIIEALEKGQLRSAMGQTN